MKFTVKIGDGIKTWWEEYDDPRVQSNLDAFAYGKVLCEYWNSDLRQHESPRRTLNAQVTGVGKNKRISVKVDPNQLDLFKARRVQ